MRHQRHTGSLRGGFDPVGLAPSADHLGHRVGAVSASKEFDVVEEVELLNTETAPRGALSVLSHLASAKMGRISSHLGQNRWFSMSRADFSQRLIR